MKLKKGYYWVNTITVLRGGQIPIKHISVEARLAYCYGDTSNINSYIWELIGTSETFKTYTNDKNVGHNETCIIPLAYLPIQNPEEHKGKK